MHYAVYNLLYTMRIIYSQWFYIGIPKWKWNLIILSIRRTSGTYNYNIWLK